MAQVLGKRKERPARRQAEEVEPPPEELSGGIYNIWYHKTCGDYSTWRDRRDMKLQGKRYIVDPEKDSGLTKARKDAYICLYFARGKCVQGADCSYLHRLPTEEDERRVDMAHDIFGRERHRDDREDMGGVGSFERNNKTLYLGGLKRSSEQEKIIRKHFGVYGEITYLRVIHSKSIAFVQYKFRTAAEFAKEAMADQTLDGNEVLNVRWANEDPNPAAKARQHRDLEQEAAEVVKDKYPEYWDYYSNMYTYNQYPDTDTQYPQIGYDGQPSTEEQWNDYYSTYGYEGTAESTATEQKQEQTGTEEQTITDEQQTITDEQQTITDEQQTVTDEQQTITDEQQVQPVVEQDVQSSTYSDYYGTQYQQNQTTDSYYNNTNSGDTSQYYQEGSADYYNQYQAVPQVYRPYAPQFIMDPERRKIDAEKRRIEAVIQQSLLEQQIVQQEPEQDPGQETQF